MKMSINDAGRPSPNLVRKYIRIFHYRCSILGPEVEPETESSVESAESSLNTAQNVMQCGKLPLLKVKAKFQNSIAKLI